MKLNSTLLGIILASLIIVSIPVAAGSVPWANQNYNYRIPITVQAGSLERVNCPVNASIDFSIYTQQVVDKSSIRLYMANGTEVPSQLQWLTNSNCTIYFRVTIPANNQAVYYLYFSAGTTITAPAYTSDLSLSGTTVENAKYKIQWDTNTDAKGIYIKNNSATTNLIKTVSDQEHSLLYVYVEPDNFFQIKYPHSTTETNGTINLAKVVTSGPELVIMNLYQRTYQADVTKNMTLYFYPAQNYFIVDEQAEYDQYSADGYMTLQWCVLMDCGTTPTSYADTQGRFYTAENPNKYGLGLVWLQKDSHITWKSFNEGKLAFDLPTFGWMGDENQHSVYAIVLDSANIRETTENVYNWLTNRPTTQVAQTAETATASLQASAPSTLTVAPNANNPLTLTITNTGNVAAQNIHVSAAGVPVSWITVSEDYFTLDANAQKTLTVTINPASASDGEYNLTLSVSTASLQAQNVAVSLKVSSQATVAPTVAATATTTPSATNNAQTSVDNNLWLYIAAVIIALVVVIVVVLVMVKMRKSKRSVSA